MAFSTSRLKLAIKSPVASRSGKTASTAHKLPPVTIDSGFPDEVEMSAIRKLRVPKLKKITTSLF